MKVIEALSKAVTACFGTGGKSVTLLAKCAVTR